MFDNYADQQCADVYVMYVYARRITVALKSTIRDVIVTHSERIYNYRGR
jgi:hypothetical protein